MSVQSINHVLEQIQLQAREIESKGSTDGIESSHQFNNILLNSINSINNMQNTAKHQAEDYISGVRDIGLNDVMISLQKSSLALNLGVQVRNKLVSAYQDIMSMSI